MSRKKLRPIRPDVRSAPPFGATRWQRFRAGLERWSGRALWWRLLDWFESSRLARVGLYCAAFGAVLAVAWTAWGQTWWMKRNAVKIARQWMAAGNLRYAAEAAQEASQLAPESPEPWQIAAQLARMGGQRDQAMEYSRRAAELAPGDFDLHLAWAGDALLAGKSDEADRALDRLPIDEQAGSSIVQRLRGEMARRAGQLTAAKSFFESARRIEGPIAANQVPLGLVLLDAANPVDRQRGLDLLTPWTSDVEWGATALRVLLADAVAREARPEMEARAEALRRHPAVTVGDMPNCLAALQVAAPARYAEVLAELQRNHAVSPQAAAQLLNWLNQIGRGADAVAWMRTLPGEAMQRPPLVAAAAEALRQAGDWPALAAWTATGNWGREADFLRWLYGWAAGRARGDGVVVDETWRTLTAHVGLDGVHGVFAASLVYSWGYPEEALALWWVVAEQDGTTAREALGSLGRHYQVKRDAEGQYRVFRRLNLMQPQDASVGNNFAFFAALTGRQQKIAEKVARENHQAAPNNPVYAATYAFTLSQQNRPDEALAVLAPWEGQAERSPALAFAYGMALAGAGRREEARRLLDGLRPETLTEAEVALIRVLR